MMHARSHARPSHAEAAAPTVSLLRLSAAERLCGAGVLAGLVWALVLAVVG